MNDSPDSPCPFCQLPPDRVIEENSLAVAIADGYPVTPGHTLVIVRRHTADFFDLSPHEQAAVFDLLARMRRRLESDSQPAGFNIGINVGTAAGQTIMHAHVHLIPRYPGDVPDPTGGVRNVFPGKGRYF
jgi:diadenosine tetraphosphate (Ap4A) HIT family hydrolase